MNNNTENLTIPAITEDLDKIDNFITELETKYNTNLKKKKKESWTISSIFPSTNNKMKEFDINFKSLRRFEELRTSCVIHSEEELLEYLHKENNNL